MYNKQTCESSPNPPAVNFTHGVRGEGKPFLMFTYTHKQINKQTNEHKHKHKHEQTHTHTHIHTHTHTYICIYTRARTHKAQHTKSKLTMHTCARAHTHIHVNLKMHAYIRLDKDMSRQLQLADSGTSSLSQQGSSCNCSLHIAASGDAIPSKNGRARALSLAPARAFSCPAFSSAFWPFPVTLLNILF